MNDIGLQTTEQMLRKLGQLWSEVYILKSDQAWRAASTASEISLKEQEIEKLKLHIYCRLGL